ncbi:hypothetical protein RJT34_24487 [Clitoria ternatea]|uniref:Histone H2A n=1 Tax=Clitoria ternatea TaxID=43366 RepID=A0AAN9FN48_CLITE
MPRQNFRVPMDAGGKIKKGAEGRKEGGPKKKPVIHFVRAGLQFSVGIIGCYLKKGRHSQCIRIDAPVYLTAVLEYLAAKVLELLVGNVAHDNKKNKIIPRHLVVRNDEELGRLLVGVTTHGGVLPNINPVLLPKKTDRAPKRA